jgi:ABC-type transport system involved in multi-copper enzyme maturation permease subunit
MLGPVFHLELQHGSRRGRQFTFRWLYAGWLLAEFLALFLHYQAQSPSWGNASGLANRSLAMQAFSTFARAFAELFVVQQFLLLLLAMPAFAAGSITDEKVRGTLQDLLTTNLTATEIILGKLLAQVVRVTDLALAGFPLFCFAAVLAGMHPLGMLTALVSVVPPLFALGALTLLASVWCRTTNEAVLNLYLFGAAGFVVLTWLGPGTAYFDPLYVLEPVWERFNLREWGGRLLQSGLAWGALAVVAVLLAVWRLRPAYLRQIGLENSRRTNRPTWGQRPAVGQLPIRWKEQYVERLAVLPILRRVPFGLGVGAVFMLTLVTSGYLWAAHLPPGTSCVHLLGRLVQGDVAAVWAVLAKSQPAGEAFLTQGIAVLVLASLAVGIRCSAAVCGERERRTWEALLLTPLEPGQLLRGKLWGVLHASRSYLLAYTLPAVVFAALAGFDALFWILFCWLATVCLMYYMGAVGIRCSVRATSSWRSLLATLTSGLRALLLRCLFQALPLGVLAVILPALLILALILFLDALLGTSLLAIANNVTASWGTTTLVAVCFVAVILTFAETEYFLQEAEKQLAQDERIRQGSPPNQELVLRSRSLRHHLGRR